MKANRIIKLCALSFLCGVFLFGWTIRWIWIPGAPPIPYLMPKPPIAACLWDVWQQTLVVPALWLWAE